MSTTIEGVLLVYGTPNEQAQILTRDAAIKAAYEAWLQGKIASYRIEGDEETGKIYATLSVSKEEPAITHEIPPIYYDFPQ